MVCSIILFWWVHRLRLFSTTITKDQRLKDNVNCGFLCQLVLSVTRNTGCMMTKAMSASEQSPYPLTFPLRAKWRWCERHNSLSATWSLSNKITNQTCIHAMCSILFLQTHLQSYCVFADREPHLPSNVYSGRGWPEQFKHRERRPGRSLINF